MIAEVVPPARELATKADIGDLRSEIADVRTDMADVRTEIAELRGDLRASIEELRGEMVAGFKGVETRMARWLLGYFVPLWAGVWATVLTLILTR